MLILEIVELNIPYCAAAPNIEETKEVLALMKRLTISAEEAESTAAVSEVVAIVKKGGVAALKVSFKFAPWPLQRIHYQHFLHGTWIELCRTAFSEIL